MKTLKALFSAFKQMLISEETGLNLTFPDTKVVLEEPPAMAVLLPELISFAVEVPPVAVKRIGNRKRSAAKKRVILAWAKKHDRLPSRKSKFKIERSLGYSMENYLSKESPAFDPAFRETIFSKFPRKSNHKRSHDKEARIKEIMEFITAHRRLPRHRTAKGVSEYEKIARVSLDNYTDPTSSVFDPEIRKLIQSLDPNFGNSGMPIKRRPLLEIK